MRVMGYHKIKDKEIGVCGIWCRDEAEHNDAIRKLEDLGDWIVVDSVDKNTAEHRYGRPVGTDFDPKKYSIAIFCQIMEFRMTKSEFETLMGADE